MRPFLASGTSAEKRARPEDPNVAFYSGKMASRPNGDRVDVIHAEWADQFERLERHHGYIQWLFPVFENAGMNWESSVLTPSGAQQIRSDKDMSERVLRSYRLMLRFYGLRLSDERVGTVERDPEDENGARMRNFNDSSHNFLRISRILTSLGELGFHRYKAPLLAALRAEVAAGRLRRARDSLENFWARVVEEEDSAWYARKTLEKPVDRAEGCLFAPGGRLGAEAAPAPAEPPAEAEAAGAEEAEAPSEAGAPLEAGGPPEAGGGAAAPADAPGAAAGTVEAGDAPSEPAVPAEGPEAEACS